MPGFSDILNLVQQSAVTRGLLGPDFDGIRRSYTRALSAYTGRPTIVYYSNWMTMARPETAMLMSDMQAMMEMVRDMKGTAVDILLQSPGGSPEATAAIVHYLRSKFDDMRVFIPLAAMSAATMWSLAADRIVMGKHSQLGPIDPQIQIPTATAAMQLPARSIIKQFERAKDELATNPKWLAAWLPLIQQYPPGLLQYCQDSEDLSKKLVRDWLARYMFRAMDPKDAAAQASEIADYFADAGEHLSHGLGIYRDAARDRKLVIDDLESDPRLQDAVLSVHHAFVITMNFTQVLKIVENSLDRAYMTVAPPPIQVQFGQAPIQIPTPVPPPTTP